LKSPENLQQNHDPLQRAFKRRGRAVGRPCANGAPADAPLAARVGQTIAGERRAPEAPTLVRTHGYVEFDWSSAGGVVPGFEPLPSTGNSSAGAQ